MPFFYTGKGDRGNSQVGKKRYPKDSLLMEALGNLDELNSLLGLIRSRAEKSLKAKLFLVQENLFIAQAGAASLMFPKFKGPSFSKEKVQHLEKEIAKIEKEIKPKRGFLISGEEEMAAWLDFARAVCRRAERSLIKLNKKQKLPRELIPYLNRLSSYLYALARLETKKKKSREKTPRYK